jgi:hypothetical protein
VVPDDQQRAGYLVRSHVPEDLLSKTVSCSREIERKKKRPGRNDDAILDRHGFTEVRKTGSHIVMQKKLSGGTITIPVRLPPIISAG